MDESTIDADKTAIDRVVSCLFACFDNKGGKIANLGGLPDIFMPDGVVVKTCGEPPAALNLAEFVAPRDALLNGGDLVDFSEQELWEKTDVFGSVAHRLCLYRKSGVLSGKPFETQGMKSIQLVKTESGWKISSLIWDDERPGISVPAFSGDPAAGKKSAG